MKEYYFTLIIFLIFNTLLLSQELEKGLKALEKDNLKKAENIFQEIIISNPKHSIANYGLAMVYSSDNYEKPDLFKALEMIILADKTFGNLNKEEINEIATFINKDSIISAKSKIDNKVFLYLKKQNRMDLILQYVEKYTDAPGYVDVVEYLNDLEFRDAKSFNTIDAYNLFISKYPTASQVQEAKQLRSDLIFADAQRKNTLEAYDDFVKKYPDSKKHSKAKQIRDQMAYKKVTLRNSLESYEEFITKYPDAEQIEEAKSIRDQLAFDKAKSENTVDAYKNYIKKYPNSKLIAEAKQSMLEITYNQVVGTSNLAAINSFVKENPGTNYTADILNLKAEILGNQYLSQLSHKENVKWIKGYDNLGKRDKPEIIVSTLNSEVYIAGNSNSEEIWYKDIWIVKLGSDGNFVWEKQIGEQYDDQVNFMCLDSEENLIICGHKDSQGAKSGKMRIVKIATDGKILWDKSLEGTTAVAHTLDFDNNIYVSGYKILEDGNSEIITAKFDSNGKLLWNKTISERGMAFSMAFQNNQVYIVSSKSLIILNAEGDIINEPVFQEDDKIEIMKLTPEGSILLAGKTFNFRNKTKSDLLVIQMNDNGNVLWRKTFDKNGDHESASDMIIKPDGNILVAALAAVNNDADDNIWIIELSGNGAKVKETNIGSLLNEKRTSMVQVAGKEVYIITSQGLNSDYLLINIEN